MSEEGTITIRKESLWKYSTFILAAVLIVGAFMFFGKNDSGTTGRTVNNPSVPAQGEKVEVSLDDDAVLGNPNAPVTIVEFSDYQCPFCGRFWSDTLPDIKKNYIETGKVKLVYRDFPLESIHPMAMPAAIALECVREKGKDEAYWKMHDKVFANQGTLSVDNLKKWAKELGYDIGTCLDSEKFKSEVQNDLQQGSSYGVRGTPAFFINGNLISGAQPYSVFEQAIEAELK
jgi:protein-disulfide isomerase